MQFSRSHFQPLKPLAPQKIGGLVSVLVCLVLFGFAALGEVPANPFEGGHGRPAAREFSFKQVYVGLNIVGEKTSTNSLIVDSKGPLIGELARIEVALARVHPLYEFKTRASLKSFLIWFANYASSGLSPPQTPVV